MRTALERVAADIRESRTTASADAWLPFADITTIHFARFVVVEPPADTTADAMLVMATNHDGPRERHLDQMIEHAGEPLRAIFSCCRGFPEVADDGVLARYVLDHARREAAFYRGHPHRSVSQVRNEEQLRRRLQASLGDAPSLPRRDPHRECVERVQGDAELRWAVTPPDAIGHPRWKKLAALAGAGLGALVRLVPPALLALPRLRQLERRDAREQRRRQPSDAEVVADTHALDARTRALLEVEDLNAQNELTTITDVKSGWLRLQALRLTLAAIGFLAEWHFDRGRLGQISSIHFARWLIVEQAGRHRLVFFTNYDDTWENYLGQFIDQASTGLTAIWGHTVGFPETHWLVGGGSRHEAPFKAFVRRHQHRAPVWYSAYRNLTVGEVNGNSEIRCGLSARLSLEEARAWSRRF